MRHWIDGLFSPLTVAAYVAWAVVWVGSADGLARLGSTGSGLSRLALIAFLAGFAACVGDLVRLGPRTYRLLCLALATVALAFMATSRSGVSPILLVLVIAVLAARLQGRELIVCFVLLNLCFLAVVLFAWRLDGDRLWVTFLAQVTFQAFAALLMRAARRAEDMTTQLRATNAELLTTRTLLAEGVRDQERLRLSRELHDVAGHGLTALKLNLESLSRDPSQPDRERVATCLGLADGLLSDLRRVVRQMRDDPCIDLRGALERLSLPFPRPSLRVDLPDDPQLSDRGQFEAVLRAVQEALTNAARHGHARELRVALRALDGEWELDIEDDGRAPEELATGGGLSGMRERFEQLGGSLRHARSATGGLRLEARWPRAAAT